MSSAVATVCKAAFSSRWMVLSGRSDNQAAYKDVMIQDGDPDVPCGRAGSVNQPQPVVLI
jgi:hypothetical protein